MLRRLAKWWGLWAVGAVVPSALGFSLLGPVASWMDNLKYYNLTGDIGNGPMARGEGYRRNFSTIYYGFDRSFIEFFGTKGIEAVDAAVQIMNDLPPASQMDLSKFPLSTLRDNYKASALLLVDLKSVVLWMLLEQLGLAESERWVWCLRESWDAGNNNWNHVVIKRNYDPETLLPSSYVNGVLYTYRIQRYISPADPSFDAVETPVDPLALLSTSVTGTAPSVGQFFTGLTRDDAGGLKYLYSTLNRVVETPVAGAEVPTNVFGGIPWYPIGLTNLLNTNVITATNLAFPRAGIEKVTFVKVDVNPMLGQLFQPITNLWMDTFFTNTAQGSLQTATMQLQRVITVPDILFAAGDLGLQDHFPIDNRRNVAMVNNSALNTLGTATELYGPGVINPPSVITFSRLGPSYHNGPGFLTEQRAQPIFVFQWGSFDGTTNDPVVFPVGTAAGDLRQMYFGP